MKKILILLVFLLLGCLQTTHQNSTEPNKERIDIQIWGDYDLTDHSQADDLINYIEYSDAYRIDLSLVDGATLEIELAGKIDDITQESYWNVCDEWGPWCVNVHYVNMITGLEFKTMAPYRIVNAVTVVSVDKDGVRMRLKEVKLKSGLGESESIAINGTFYMFW